MLLAEPAHEPEVLAGPMPRGVEGVVGFDEPSAVDGGLAADQEGDGGLGGVVAVPLFSEVLRAHRAIEVNDLDELTEVLSVCQGTRWPTGRRIAVTTASGGQAELILDVATTCKLDLPPLSTPDRADVEQVIGSITGDGNPLDAWGNGVYAT